MSELLRRDDDFCEVCGTEKDANSARCSVCGFPYIGISGLTEDELQESRERVRKAAGEYRAKYWNCGKLYLEVYTNKLENDKIKVAKTERILLGDYRELPEDEIVWYSGEKFARLVGNCKLNLIAEWNGVEKAFEVNVKNPNTDGFWYVGIKRLAETKLCLAVGDKSKFSLSLPVSLFG